MITGNLVRIQNCPAAVSRNESLTTRTDRKDWEAEAIRNPGDGSACKSEDLPSGRVQKRGPGSAPSRKRRFSLIVPIANTICSGMGSGYLEASPRAIGGGSPPTVHDLLPKDYLASANENCYSWPRVAIGATATFRLRAAHSDGEDHRLAVSQPRLRFPAAVRAVVPACPCLARGASWIRDNTR